MIRALSAVSSVALATAATGPVTVRVTDWASMPFSGNVTTGSGNPGYMARINFTKEEPGGTGRMWTCDLNGNLHIFSRGGTPANRTAELLTQARNRSAYLDFNGRSATTDTAEKVNIPNSTGTSTSQAAPNGLFPLFTKKQGYANGLVTFEFDPGYATNGKFYTIHIETISADDDDARLPVKTKFPGFNTTGYTYTDVINPAGSPTRQGVLIEWTDTDRGNLTFEGTARELLRIGFNSHIHPLGDIAFDPTAEPGDPEWGVMYLACGDGGAGESNIANDDGIPALSPGDRHYSPQRLDSLVGKILRIVPDLTQHTDSSSVSDNERYRIPNDNPFADSTSYPGARKEVWTLGHRNPHRFLWYVPQANPAARKLLVTEIGLKAWEEVNLLKRGGNYGYAEREGPQRLIISTNSGIHQTTGALPSPDTLPIQLTANSFAPGDVVPEYPVIAYPHTAAFGDAISSGFFYRGTAIPGLQGKFVFADITTGRLWCSEWTDMVEADDGDPATLAGMQPVTLVWDNPNDSPDAGLKAYDRFFEIVEAGYDFRGGVDADLPGGATISGTGRADIRLAVDAAGELYVTSKSDGVIRSLGIVAPPVLTTQPVDKWISVGSDADFTVVATSSPAPSYRWQRLASGSNTWQNLSEDSVCSGTGTASLHVESPGKERSGDLYRCVVTCTGAEAVSSAAMLEMKVVPTSWLDDYFDSNERAKREIAGDLSDPDKDGIVNLLEYAFGFDPEKNSSALLPKIGKSGTNATLSFPAPRSTSFVTYSVEASSDLLSWSTTGVTITTSSGIKTARYPMSAEKAFLRIVVR
ncbi:PQQ-dependent sugar dehydrogenase [Luteolibacter arcticus]|uniref:PQQ-dependent sugar dehydrogenase n=1 Tax=Luteolibacter arcticus TaxID=1581411 RepID=A0ABT3GQ15_9BACT|nr:PQQ-dependent sugar dehydrogenase [Luteolibacter arcticus]MCW1925618.1 PQQ-dependent sugar dehydrogenase [Luteolibacter arcticus]